MMTIEEKKNPNLNGIIISPTDIRDGIRNPIPVTKHSQPVE